MRHLAARLISCVGLALAFVVGLAAPAHASYDWAAVDARLTTATTNCAEICTAVIGVERMGATAGTVDVVLKHNFGRATTPDYVYTTASSGKWLSGATVMTVVDRGQISLDSTIGQWFPAYTGTTKGTTTLRQLMSHTNGWSGIGDDPPCLGDQTTTIAACVDIILQRPQEEPPGTKFRYTGLGMQIAGRMIELATGKPWVQVFQENLATPLGLSTKTKYMSSTNPKIGGGSFNNGMQTTSTDYLRFLEMLIGHGNFRGTQVLSPAAFNTMESDQTNHVPIAYAPVADMKGYGIGNWIEKVDGQGKGTLFTSPGAYGIEPWYDPTRNAAGVLLISSNMAKGEELIDHLRPIIEQQLDTNPTPPPKPTIVGLSPTKGPAAGGGTVTITGTNFTGATGVRFGPETWAASYAVVNNTTITVTVPARVPSFVNVFVETPAGLSVANSKTLYWYQ